MSGQSVVLFTAMHALRPGPSHSILLSSGTIEVTLAIVVTVIEQLVFSVVMINWAHRLAIGCAVAPVLETQNPLAGKAGRSESGPRSKFKR
ncbi:hypothetical protein IEU95_04755 [Hoyosella rhizosphaerae]|uniref:hypothetical protein n=1 Tax=Hoyosella rhizosphaerae TaxID=1755582 RepID=UPI00166E7224|nr:hypothetical protein [Hoyosella rhizosphaerae]MBN4926127.1 hypothetical protein [Hoyosella rhizosphaerae]